MTLGYINSQANVLYHFSFYLYCYMFYYINSAYIL
jgi:hypothetical protein